MAKVEYAKLLAMIVQHWLFLVSHWSHFDRSLFKAAKTIRGHALHWAAHLSSRHELEEAIAIIRRCLLAGCRINMSQVSPPTYQLRAGLESPPGPAPLATEQFVVRIPAVTAIPKLGMYGAVCEPPLRFFP